MKQNRVRARARENKSSTNNNNIERYELLVGISRSFISFLLFSRGFLTIVTEFGNRVAEKEGRKVRPCPATAAKMIKGNGYRKLISEWTQRNIVPFQANIDIQR